MKTYEEIKTARELINNVKVHGLKNDMESINRAQDIFGHTSIDALEDLAHEDQSTFYFILFNIWNWSEAIEFYNSYSNEIFKKLIEENKKLIVENQQLERLKESSEKLRETVTKIDQKAWEKEKEVNRLRTEIKTQEYEIIKLKAKLYDMMNN